jgi:hypothetical protein
MAEVAVLVRMPEALREKLRARAAAEDRSMAWIVRAALASYLADELRSIAGPDRDPGSCTHPIGRRIGDRCMACGSSVPRYR